MVETDYTSEAKADSMKPGYMQGYKLMHWLRDILQNFFSSPINIRDERLCGLLNLQDGATDDQLGAMFRVDLPYNPKAICKAGTTPCVLVSEGETTYPARSATIAGTGAMSVIGGPARYHGLKYRTIQAQIAVVTETCDGTMLMSGLIEDFLVMHELELAKDCGMISQFSVLGSSGVQAIQTGADANAKQLYQKVITVSMTGGLSWTSDSQGPVFRGIRMGLSL